jgi:RING-box protein 1
MSNNIFEVKNILLSFNPICKNIKNEICAICRNNLLEKCIQCQVKTSIDCKSVLGCCGHGYHKCCIDKWCLTRSICPLDDQQWIVKNNI